MDFKVEYLLTLNSEVVPAPEQVISYLDPLGLAENLELDFDQAHQVKMVSFKATQSLKWLEKALKLPAQYLKANLRKFPLIQEIQNAVEETKKKDLKKKHEHLHSGRPSCSCTFATGTSSCRTGPTV